MKAITKQELEEESQIFSEAWNFMKTHTPETDDDWKTIVDDACNFAEKHKDCYDFAKELILSVVFELERKEKQNKLLDHYQSLA